MQNHIKRDLKGSSLTRCNYFWFILCFFTFLTGCKSTVRLPEDFEMTKSEAVDLIDHFVKSERQGLVGPGTTKIGADEEGWVDMHVQNRMTSGSRVGFSIIDDREIKGKAFGEARRLQYSEIEKVQMLYLPYSLFTFGIAHPTGSTTIQVWMRNGDFYQYGYMPRTAWGWFPMWIINPFAFPRSLRHNAHAFEFMRVEN